MPPTSPQGSAAAAAGGTARGGIEGVGVMPAWETCLSQSAGCRLRQLPSAFQMKTFGDDIRRAPRWRKISEKGSNR